jgi:hypothetical protein
MSSSAASENINPTEEVEKNDVDEYFSDFGGIVSDYETPNNGNFGLNFKNNDQLSLICPDAVNNVIYYVNYGKDNYIYELKDNKSTLLVDRKANYLQLWNNELYFLNDVSDKKQIDQLYYPQNIYKYNLETRELTLLLDINATWLYVSRDGIFFTEVKDDDNDGLPDIFAGYKLAFDSDFPQKLDNIFFLPYKEYLLKQHFPGGLILHNTLTADNLTLIPSPAINNMVCISGDNLYSVDQRKLYSLNLKTSEKSVYNIDSFESQNDYTGMIICGYSELNNELLVSLGGSIVIRINKVSGSMEESIIPNCSILSDLFTSGDRLFAVAEMTEENWETHTALVELIVDEYQITARELTE